MIIVICYCYNNVTNSVSANDDWDNSRSSTDMYGHCSKCDIRLSKGDTVFVLAGCQCMIHAQCYYQVFHGQSEQQLNDNDNTLGDIYISCPGCPGVSKSHLNEKMTL